MTLSFYSSRSSRENTASLKEVVMTGLAADGGLYIPVDIPKVEAEFIHALSEMSESEIVEELSAIWLEGSVEEPVARALASDAIHFPTPLISLSASDFVLELFHGPTLAFKDYGARYMARLLSHFLSSEAVRQTILVATSGDTGSAVASGFLGLENIHV